MSWEPPGGGGRLLQEALEALRGGHRVQQSPLTALEPWGWGAAAGTIGFRETRGQKVLEPELNRVHFSPTTWDGSFAPSLDQGGQATGPPGK